MGNVDLKGSNRRRGACRTLQSMYEAARKEVLSDPAAAVLKYQPSWHAALPVAPRKSGRHR
jgi:hypothetical protein